MKRFALIVMVGLVALSGVAFAGGQGETAADDDGIVIGFSNASVSNSWRVFMVANFNAEVALHPEITDVYYTDADDRPEKQVADIEDLLVRGIDVLVVSPAVEDAVTPAIEQAYDMGIPVLLFDRTINSESYTTFLEASSYEMGRGMAEWLVEELDGEGNVVLISGLAGASAAEDRLRGALEVFEQHPGINILGQQYTDWSTVRAKEVMEAFIQQHPQIDGVWGDSGLCSWPALEALQEAGRDLVPSTGDQLNAYAKFLYANDARGFIYPYPANQARDVVQWAIRAANGEDIPKHIEIPVTPIPPEALADYVKPDESDFWWVGDDQMPAEFLPEL